MREPRPYHLLPIAEHHRPSEKAKGRRALLGLAIFLSLYAWVSTDEFNVRELERQAIHEIR